MYSWTGPSSAACPSPSLMLPRTPCNRSSFMFVPCLITVYVACSEWCNNDSKTVGFPGMRETLCQLFDCHCLAQHFASLRTRNHQITRCRNWEARMMHSRSNNKQACSMVCQSPCDFSAVHHHNENSSCCSIESRLTHLTTKNAIIYHHTIIYHHPTKSHTLVVSEPSVRAMLTGGWLRWHPKSLGRQQKGLWSMLVVW